MSWTVERLLWSDAVLGEIELPKAVMRLRAGFGSGLATRPGDPAGTVWAVGDRGPNLKVKPAITLYGLDRLEPLRGVGGAKIMPRPDLGPAIAELRVAGDRVELVRILRIADPLGRPVSGLPIPGGPHALCEPAFGLDGGPLPSDPSGLDSEGIAALPDGGFWVGDEYGPSLVRLGPDGRVLKRIVPEGSEIDGAAYPVETRLPAIAARRQINRGFEAVALSPDGRWLFLAFQSPLAHPDVAAHKAARHVRIWRLDAATLAVEAQYLYPPDPPDAFRRDLALGRVERSDIKVSELTWIAGNELLVLERVSQSAKIYRVRLDPGAALPVDQLDVGKRPSVEELSAEERLGDLPTLDKRLVFDSDRAPEVPADLEGMAILSPCELLLVNDNDFGVEGVETQFWKIAFDRPVF